MRKAKKRTAAAKTADEACQTRERRGEFAGIVGMVVNLALAAGKFGLGMLSGSVSVMADAANNLTDCGSCLLTLLGFRLAARPADREHPFGHARYEYVCGLLIALLTLLLGFSFLKESVGRIVAPPDTHYSVLTLALLGSTAVVKLFLAGFYRKIGKSVNSQTLRASSVDSVSDAVLTLVVLAGGLIRQIRGVEADGWIGAAVALVILYAGGKTVREATGLLVGKAPDPAMVERIRTVLSEREGVLGVHDLMVHSYGEGRYFATAHIEIDARTDLLTAHAIADATEADVRAKTGVQLVIHVDPRVVNDPKQTLLREDLDRILRGISPALRYHDFHMDPSGGKVCFDLVVPEHFVLPDGELLSLIQEEIGRSHPDLEAAVTLDRDFGDREK